MTTKIADLTNDELVKVYIQLRDRRTVRKAAFENEDAADKAKQEKIEGILLQRYREQGIESARTQYGTAYISEVNYASVADWDALLEHIKTNDAWELLNRAVNKASVAAFIEANADIPPGVNWRTEKHIRVNRA